MSCREVEERLVDLLDGRLDGASELRLHAHIEECAACRERWNNLAALVPVMRAIAPKPPSEAKLRRMEAVVERRLAAPRDVIARPRRLGWLALAATAAAVIAIVGARLRRQPEAPPLPPPIAHRAVPERISAATGEKQAIVLPQGASLTLTGPGRLRIAGDDLHVELSLDEGRLEAQVEHRRPGESFVVRVPLGRVEVRGTRFVVMVAARESWVRVDEGRVASFDADGAESSVGPGQTHSFVAPTLAPPVVAAPAASTPHRQDCNEPLPDCDVLVARVRGAIRERRHSDAVDLADPALHPRGACARRTLYCRDELGYLRAEALRLDGRLDAAIAAYKALDRREARPATRQNALYAAAQLERAQGSYLEARADFERALAAAPSGALREEAMLGALDAADHAGDRAAALEAARRYLAAFPAGMGASEARRVEAAYDLERGTAP